MYVMQSPRDGCTDCRPKPRDSTAATACCATAERKGFSRRRRGLARRPGADLHEDLVQLGEGLLERLAARHAGLLHKQLAHAEAAGVEQVLRYHLAPGAGDQLLDIGLLCLLCVEQRQPMHRGKQLRALEGSGRCAPRSGSPRRASRPASQRTRPQQRPFRRPAPAHDVSSVPDSARPATDCVR